MVWRDWRTGGGKGGCVCGGGEWYSSWNSQFLMFTELAVPFYTQPNCQRLKYPPPTPTPFKIINGWQSRCSRQIAARVRGAVSDEPTGSPAARRFSKTLEGRREQVRYSAFSCFLFLNAFFLWMFGTAGNRQGPASHYGGISRVYQTLRFHVPRQGPRQI